jgi:hypothetical protein
VWNSTGLIDRVAREIQTAGLASAGLYCLILAAWKLATGVDWSWWRVLLPLWLLVAHNLLAAGLQLLYWRQVIARGEDS